MNEPTLSVNTQVVLSMLKLARAMRRCPPDPGRTPFPPAIGRLLECVSANSGISSRELCEILDLRPSSLSEMLTRAEQEGWILRTPDEEDRRMQHVTLSARGSAVIQDLINAREADAEKKTACLTQEEKEQFCALCNRLSEHMESLASDLPESMRPGPGGPRPHHGMQPGSGEPWPSRDMEHGSRDTEPDPGDLPPAPDSRPFRKPGPPDFPAGTRFRC